MDIGLDNIFNFKKEPDLYDIVGCAPSATAEQIQTEYKVRARRLHPDKNVDSQQAEKDFQLLQYAKEVLCDEGRRRDYDKWRSSGLAVPYSEWRSLQDRVHTSMHWAVPRTSGRMLSSGECSAVITGTTDRVTDEHVGQPTLTTAVADESTPSGEGRTASASVRWGRPGHVDWPRAPLNEMIRKFRNYEI